MVPTAQRGRAAVPAAPRLAPAVLTLRQTGCPVPWIRGLCLIMDALRSVNTPYLFSGTMGHHAATRFKKRLHLGPCQA